jgi:hypothetical protein
MRSILFLAAMALVATPVTAASPCRDAHGKFIKCPPKPAAKAKPAQCRDAKGKFIKCKK